MTHAIAVGERPGDISAGAGALWVANLDDDSVSKIDPRAARLANTWSTGKSVDGLTTAGDAVWTIDGPDATALRIDPNFGQVVKRHPTGQAAAGHVDGTAEPDRRLGPFRLGFDWERDGRPPRDQRPATSTGTADLGNEPAAIADGAGATWVADDLDDTVSRIDRAGSRDRRDAGGSHGAAPSPSAPAAVWVADTLDGTVTRLDPATGAPTSTIDVGAGPTGIAVGVGCRLGRQ